MAQPSPDRQITRSPNLLRFDVVTLFPEMFAGVLDGSILGRAARAVPDPAAPDDRTRDRPAVASYHLYQLRDFSDDAKHQKVDRPPYGGGAGMVLRCQPLRDCVRHIQAQEPEVTPHRIFLTPTGRPLTQRVAEALAGKPRLLLICGHYEGYDQRVLDALREDEAGGGLDEISVGDVVLSGGELPAMTLIDAVVRLLPGALGDADSARHDSFSPGVDRLLDHPHYTHPPVWEGRAVPEVLRSGDHGKIAAWRERASRDLTEARRPDLLIGGGRGGAAEAIPVATFVDLEAASGEGLDRVASLHAEAYGDSAAAERVKLRHTRGDAVLSLGVELGGDLVAHALLSPANLADQPGLRGLLWLEGLAVRSAYRRRGLASALVREAARQAKDAGAVRLLVRVGRGDVLDWTRLGFEIATCFRLPDAASDELWMMDLRPGRALTPGQVVLPD